MAGVPQKTLSWLYDVLKREYRDPNRAYSDLAQTLAQYPGFAPRTDVYTSENGAPALLLNLKGTLPVNFRGTVYRFPVAIWIPHAYPYEAPMLYVNPTDDMMVRQGQHVSGADGRIYHQYLARWSQTWDRSNVVEFLNILAEIFAREPPVMAKQQGMARQQSVSRGPPAVPPPPQSPQRYVHQGPPGNTPGGPPPPPPKQPAQSSETSRSDSVPPTAPRTSRYDAPPPLPSQNQSHNLRPQSGYSSGQPQQPPVGMHYIQQERTNQGYSVQHGQPAVQQYRVQSPPGLVASASPPPQPVRQQSFPQPHPASPPSMQTYQQYQQANQPNQISTQPQPQPYTQTPQQQQQQRAHPQTYLPPRQQQIQPPQPKPQPPKDLLSEEDPFQVSLPRSATNVPAPPIPTNPEKTALLSHLSHHLLTTLHASITNTQTTALPPLQSQNQALLAAQHTLQTELANLTTLKSQLESNISALQSTLSSANKVITSTSPSPSNTSATNPNKIPSIDEIIIPPSVIARQLYDSVAEQRGYEAAIYALNEAFVRGRIGAEVWGRRCREMAREEFRRKWMVRRIARGLGLEGT